MVSVQDQEAIAELLAMLNAEVGALAGRLRPSNCSHWCRSGRRRRGARRRPARRGPYHPRGGRERPPRAGAAAVPPLLEALLHEDADFRRAAVVTRTRPGPAAAAAVPALTVLLQDEQLRPWAAEALLAIEHQRGQGLTQDLHGIYSWNSLVVLGLALVPVFGLAVISWSAQGTLPR